MFTIGVDPGLSGALSVLNAEGGLVWTLPLGNDLTSHIQLVRDTDWWKSEERIFGAIEKQHGFPGMPTASTWSLCEGYCFARHLLEVLGIGYETPTPIQWQKVCGKVPKDRRERKHMIAAWAKQRWPDAPLYGPKGGLQDGISDSLGIAWWLYLRRAGCVR